MRMSVLLLVRRDILTLLVNHYKEVDMLVLDRKEGESILK